MVLAFFPRGAEAQTSGGLVGGNPFGGGAPVSGTDQILLQFGQDSTAYVVLPFVVGLVFGWLCPAILHHALAFRAAQQFPGNRRGWAYLWIGPVLLFGATYMLMALLYVYMDAWASPALQDSFTVHGGDAYRNLLMVFVANIIGLGAPVFIPSRKTT